ncbi:SufE family protein [Kamptonema cortianum]|nr:SufE family protein [Geitlerinema splendidum]MDK3157673.1 SufE family protein [Kamptonema cortianum]
MTIPAKLSEFLENIDLVSDRTERIDLLIEFAKEFEPINANEAEVPYPEDHRVPGCESEAFTWTFQNPDGRLRVEFAIQNPQGMSAKALAQILRTTLIGSSPQEILAIPEDIVFKIFGKDISMGKSMGLTNMIGQIKAQARTFQE